MMARAPGAGMDTGPSCEDTVPMGVVELGTSASQPSSCSDSWVGLDVYQDPAWVASRDGIVEGEDVKVRGEYVRSEW